MQRCLFCRFLVPLGAEIFMSPQANRTQLREGSHLPELELLLGLETEPRNTNQPSLGIACTRHYRKYCDSYLWCTRMVSHARRFRIGCSSIPLPTTPVAGSAARSSPPGPSPVTCRHPRGGNNVGSAPAPSPPPTTSTSILTAPSPGPASSSQGVPLQQPADQLRAENKLIFPPFLSFLTESLGIQKKTPPSLQKMLLLFFPTLHRTDIEITPQ